MWTEKKAQEKKLYGVEMRMLRLMCGVKKIDSSNKKLEGQRK